ncbi:hypothetical protein E2C01_028999 [Portunus trituberculatus]|uniref:Uncharacterized protein n=1 Tax=Portunus trituberculatus TaxID=210409 RepID=A0A5B7EQA8_PORTR|nr:hypothetical protein [Portunus trituberculatus]
MLRVGVAGRDYFYVLRDYQSVCEYVGEFLIYTGGFHFLMIYLLTSSAALLFSVLPTTPRLTFID